MTRPRTQPLICTVGDCDRKAVARGWCTMHHSRWHKTGTTDKADRKQKPKACTVDDCANTAWARGWCHTHYSRWRRHGDHLYVAPKPVKPEPGTPDAPEPRTCSIDGCNGEHKARGWCRPHYRSWQRHGDPLIGVRRGPKVERVTVPKKVTVDMPEHLVAFLRKREARMKGSRSAANTLGGRGAGNGTPDAHRGTTTTMRTVKR